MKAAGIAALAALLLPGRTRQPTVGWGTHAVAQCNGCHKTAANSFLKVPAIPQGATFLERDP